MTWEEIKIALFVIGVAVIGREIIGFFLKTGSICGKLDEIIRLLKNNGNDEH